MPCSSSLIDSGSVSLLLWSALVLHVLLLFQDMFFLSLWQDVLQASGAGQAFD
jgi:hypothetical protein